MKKYKLIKEYPDSQPKGTVFVAENEINAVFRKEGDNVIIYWDVIEKFSEYFEEVKEPIFVSADGIDMFEGDSYYVPQVNINNELIGNYVEVKADDYCKAGATKFSTKELAQEYIDNNQLKYSLTDFEKVCYLSESNDVREMIKELKKLGK